MKYLSIITLFLLSITIASIHAVDNTQYKTWYKSPVSAKIKEGSDDDQLAKLERELTGLHTASFSRKTIISKEFIDEWNEKYKNSWEELLNNIQKFIEKKHKKLTPTIKKLADSLRTLVFNVETIIKNPKNSAVLSEAQEALNKSAEKFPELFTEINTSGISTFQSTKMARELAGRLALTLDLTHNHAIKNIKEIEQSAHKSL